MDDEKLLDDVERDESQSQGQDSGQNEEQAPKEDEKKYTDKEVDEIVKKRLAREKKKQEEEIAEALKEADEARKLAEMDEDKKREYEHQKMAEELAALKADKVRSEMSATARKMLSEQNITVSDGIVHSLITEDAESTKANIDAFAESFNAAVNKEVEARLKGQTPKKLGGNKPLTKQDILGIKDEAERRRAVAENLDLFR